MPRMGRSSRWLFLVSVITVAVLIGWGGPRMVSAGPTDDGIVLAPHRAIYDLKLADSRQKRSLESVRGRILYDFSGSACEGYALKFRQVTELDSGEGKVAISDLRSTTWEDGSAKAFRFNSENFLNQEEAEAVDGLGERRSDGVAVSLTRPQRKKFDVGNVVFPTEHMRRIIAAARAGQTLLEVSVYDGSETGEKVYQSLSVIGGRIAPDAPKPADLAPGEAALSGQARWPVTVSYFDKDAHGGEQTPVYAIAFEVYENGVSRALKLDYGDFAVSGDLTNLEMKDVKPCH